ncbi:hypothetical protein [Methylosarcina fibrata]|uniref:hypothetical protein n=1 Tax=Methylosarcina fibrata TaxID=105972 RepID=UPI0012F983DB|nr:hypothetical protein [Methylosarcina fibrata]
MFLKGSHLKRAGWENLPLRRRQNAVFPAHRMEAGGKSISMERKNRGGKGQKQGIFAAGYRTYEIRSFLARRNRAARTTAAKKQKARVSGPFIRRE